MRGFGRFAGGRRQPCAVRSAQGKEHARHDHTRPRRKAGPGKLTRIVPFTVTSSRLRYHALRGLRRNFSNVFPCDGNPFTAANVKLTSDQIAPGPSERCQLTPWRSLKVSSLPSSLLLPQRGPGSP